MWMAAEARQQTIDGIGNGTGTDRHRHIPNRGRLPSGHGVSGAEGSGTIF